jgi:glycosyltransferase involved in cell wall biosynthesis
LPPRPLRVALFTGNFNYTRDGATQALGRLVEHLREVERAHVRIYAPTAPTAPAVEGLEPIPSIALPGRAEYRLGLGLTPALKRDIETFSPDVVHVATPDVVGFQAQRLARRQNRPLIASLHTRFEKYLAYYGLGFLEPVLEQQLLDFYGRCDQVLAPTLATAQWLKAAPGAATIRIWSRGVDRVLFHPSRRDREWRLAQGFGETDMVVLFFGRLVLEKGLAVFADTFDRLAAARPNTRALIVGDGPSRAWMAQRLPNAVFTGFQNGPALARAVASADVLLNPSATEAFGNVNLEAMASGLPVVCADVASSRFLVRHEQNGLLCPDADAAAYAAALSRLYERPAWRARLGSAAHNVSRAFSWDAALSSVVDSYRAAIAAHGRLAAAPARALAA